ncbi:hypothetical protein MMC19_007489 [Ptychographa xylographoides]|nr:hypothetical protein [Ptychographa xylographoides]
MTLTYTLHLLHASLARLPPAFSSSLTLSQITTSTAALAGLIDDHRIFMRLPALLSIWSWAAAVIRSPPSDPILRVIAYAQVSACAIFQYLENAAYLGSKGVILRKDREGWVGKWYIWSARFWMAHVILEFGKLGRGLILRRQQIAGDAEVTGADTEGKELGIRGLEDIDIKRRDEEHTWWKNIYINTAWFPLTIHYSMEGGFAGEAQVALLGLFAGVVGLREIWQATA